MKDVTPTGLHPRPATPWWILGSTAAVMGRLGVKQLRRQAKLANRGEIPAHVPPDCCVDFDFMNPVGGDSDVTLAWQRLQAGPDMVWTPRHGGHWIATRADVIEKIQRDSEHFSHRDVTLPVGTKPFQLLPLEADPPEHHAYRITVMPWFTPAVVKSLEANARRLAIELIESVYAKGACEFVGECAQKFPIGMFLNLVDLPMSDSPKLLRYTQYAARGNMFVRLKGMLSMHAYLGQKSAERSRNPGDDLISKLVNAQSKGRRFNERELHGMLSVLIFGGLDTVAAMLSFSMRFLAEHPEERQLLIDHPELIANAVDELIRRHGVTNTCRIVTQDYDLNGFALKAGDIVQVPNALFGLDERRFPDPLRVDFKRASPIRHAAFGNGSHRCVGANLALMELRVFLEEWLPRIPAFHIDPKDRVITASGLVNAVEHLPLEWEVSAQAAAGPAGSHL